jgi:hypothetical protein
MLNFAFLRHFAGIYRMSVKKLPVVWAACWLSVFIGGWAGAAEPQYLLAVTVAPDATAYLADRELPGIWRLEGGKLSLYFQGSKKFRTPLNAVRCVAIDAEGRLLAGDSATREVYRFGDDKQPAGLTKGQIGIPSCLAVRKSGDILVGDLEVHRIWKVAPAGGDPEKLVEVAAPRGLFVDREDRLWVLSHGKDQLLREDAAGKLAVVVPGRPFEFPSTVVVDDAGTAYVCDTYAKAIWKIESGKEPVKWVSGEPLVSPVGMAWQGKDLVIADPRAKGIVRVDPDGKMSKAELAVEQQ